MDIGPVDKPEPDEKEYRKWKEEDFLDYRKDIRYKIFRKMWVFGNSLSRWAGGKMTGVARKWDERDSKKRL